MECELNGRLLKFEDGELYWWYAYNNNGALKNPYWRKHKQTIQKTKNKEYKTIDCGGRKFKVHRVIYYIHNQEWDIFDVRKSNLIDHIDRDTFNNNIENLRVVTQQQNQFNSKAKHIHLSRSNSYNARIKCGNIRLDKCFKTEQEAIDAVAEFKLKYHQF